MVHRLITIHIDHFNAVMSLTHGISFMSSKYFKTVTGGGSVITNINMAVKMFDQNDDLLGFSEVMEIKSGKVEMQVPLHYIVVVICLAWQVVICKCICLCDINDHTISKQYKEDVLTYETFRMF